MMMIKMKNFFCFALLTLLSIGEAFAEDAISASFSKETFSLANTTLPYRKASIPGTDEKASLVIYLHGGSSKGTDNETQMNEPGIDSIYSWLLANNRKAIMLVPQASKTWLGPTMPTIKALLQTYIDRGVADKTRVYIFGGSMGGTGTWNIIATYPDFFAAAMPVAGNPSGLDAEKTSHTPLFTVMGTADVIMDISNVEPFLAEMDKYDASYKFEIEQGWTHEDVCKRSYTKSRLDWIFSHTLNSTTDITSTESNYNKECITTWYDITGHKLPYAPQDKGIYIKKIVWDNGNSQAKKVAVQ